MAKVRFGAGVIGMVGSVAGSTFTSNTAGPLVRARISGTRRYSPLASQARQAFSTTRHAWTDLTDAQRDAWIPHANALTKTDRLGVERPLTPLEAFVLVNVYNLWTVLPHWFLDPPTAFGRAPHVFGVCTFHASLYRWLTLVFDPAADFRAHNEGILAVQVSEPAALHAVRPPAAWRRAIYLNGSGISPPYFILNIYNPWHIDKDHHRQWFRISQRDHHGRMSRWFQGEIV